jgi:hypothetical protein
VVEHSEPLPQREADELLEEEKKIGMHGVNAVNLPGAMKDCALVSLTDCVLCVVCCCCCCCCLLLLCTQESTLPNLCRMEPLCN